MAGKVKQESGPEAQFEPYVEWVGGVGYREVTADQWKSAGVENQDSVFWTREEPRVPLSKFTEAAVARLAAEPNFKFVLEPPKEND